MQYSEFVELYEALAKTTKRLEKTSVLAEFLKKLHKKGKAEWIYLLKGRVLPDYDSKEFGISGQLAIKSIAFSFGIKSEEVVSRFRKIGDLGEIAEEFAGKRKQNVLFSGRLDARKVFENLLKIMNVEGKGAVEKKIGLISDLLNSASPKEAKYIVRTLLSDLRIGVADALIVDSLAKAFFDQQNDAKELISEKLDLANDFVLIFEAAAKGKKELDKLKIVPGRPIKVMLPVKVTEIEEAFRICGKPAALEHKYDGFRMLINKYKGEITLFTRKLENVTKQFPDVVSAVRKHINAENFILDTEVVGYEPKTGRYRPFEAISQRIKRKYDIDKLVNELPVEINVFDIVYYNNQIFVDKPFIERRKVIERIIKVHEKEIRPSFQIIVDNESDALKFYNEALKIGEEGIMIKKLDAPYKQGRLVGYMVKMKPEANDFDLVIVGAEHGTGKRGGWLTSYVVACRENNKFLEVGKVSSGLKEKEEEGTSYREMTKILKPLIYEEKGNEAKVKPRVVVSVTYQNIQESPSYSSGFALRFPRIKHYRPDRHTGDIATLDDIKKEAKRTRRK